MRNTTGADRSKTITSTTHASASGTAGISSLRRVTKDSLDEQLTAKALIGKDVHDSAGEKIGEVEDIVLDASGVPELASAFMNREADRDDRSMSRPVDTTAPAPTGSASARGVDSYAAGAAGDGASVTARPDTDTGRVDIGSRLGSAVAGAMSGGSAAIISAGGLMGLGQDLIRVPLSQLRYNAEEDHVTLDVSRDQISRITDSDAEDASRRVAE